MMQFQEQHYDPRTTVFVLADICEYCKSAQIPVDSYCIQVEPALQHMPIQAYIKFNPQKGTHVQAVNHGAMLIGASDFQRATLQHTPTISEEELDYLDWGGAEHRPIDWQKFGIATSDASKNKTVNFLKSMGIGYESDLKRAIMDVDDIRMSKMRQLLARKKQQRGY